VGGGSVFLNSDKHADFLLADVNPDLINLYQMLALVPDAVENHARWMFEHMGHPDGYELIRKSSMLRPSMLPNARCVPVPEPPLLQWPDALQPGASVQRWLGKIQGTVLPVR
jgi:hypothetical protein